MSTQSVASPSAINIWAVLSGLCFVVSIAIMIIFDQVSVGWQGVCLVMWVCSVFIALILSIVALVSHRARGRWVAIVVQFGCVLGYPAILFFGSPISSGGENANRHGNQPIHQTWTPAATSGAGA